MKKLAVLFLILCMTLSCSRLDMAVSLANSYVTNKADDFFDLTSEQRKWLKQALGHDIMMVKKTIFPQLAAEMFKVADTLNSQKTFDYNTVILSYNRLEGLFNDGLRIFSLTAVGFVDRLMPVQIEHFQKQADKKFSDMKEDAQKKSYNKIKKQFDSWMGGMNSKQKKELKTFVEKNPAPIKESVYNRQNLVHEFVRAYPDKVARKSFVEGIFTKYESMMDPGYKKLVNEKNKRVAIFFTNILNKMSEDQKQTLIETIRDRANQLIKISKG